MERRDRTASNEDFEERWAKRKKPFRLTVAGVAGVRTGVSQTRVFGSALGQKPFFHQIQQRRVAASEALGVGQGEKEFAGRTVLFHEIQVHAGRCRLGVGAAQARGICADTFLAASANVRLMQRGSLSFGSGSEEAL